MPRTKAGQERSARARERFTVPDLNGLKAATGWSWRKLHATLDQGEPGLIDTLAAVAARHRIQGQACQVEHLAQAVEVSE